MFKRDLKHFLKHQSHLHFYIASMGALALLQPTPHGGLAAVPGMGPPQPYRYLLGYIVTKVAIIPPAPARKKRNAITIQYITFIHIYATIKTISMKKLKPQVRTQPYGWFIQSFPIKQKPFFASLVQLIHNDCLCSCAQGYNSGCLV